MGFSDIGLRHIVDVDGQLLGIDAEVIDVASPLARASRPADSLVWMVRAGDCFAMEPKQPIRLSEADVTFLETSAALHWHAVELMAA